MKKILSILVVAFIALLSIWNVSAFWTLFESDTLSINWKEIWTWKQIYIEWVVENVVYFGARKGDEERKYYKYENGKLIEIKEDQIKNTDYSDRDNWTVNKHYKEGYDTNSHKTSITIDWKLYWPYNSDFYKKYELWNNAFYFSYVDNNSKNYINIFTYFDNKKEIKPIPKIDKILNKFFAKIDKRWEVKANILYKKIIKKIDSIISKSKSAKKRKLLEYIKIKFEEKVK